RCSSMVAKAAKKLVTKGPTKKQPLRFTIECSAEVVEKDIIDFAFFERYLREHIKVNGKVKNLGKDVHVEREKSTIHVTSSIPFSKRYLKYLTKRFLKLHNLRDYLHVIATSKVAYQLKFFNFDTEETDDEE
ncbi:60S ribosomal protein L22, partial [Nitriliruptoraceae bacterium ZYF776]|nr:60S ribosomal protein L22 [Profundirhabdus halotolerans]